MGVGAHECGPPPLQEVPKVARRPESRRCGTWAIQLDDGGDGAAHWLTSETVSSLAHASVGGRGDRVNSERDVGGARCGETVRLKSALLEDRSGDAYLDAIGPLGEEPWMLHSSQDDGAPVGGSAERGRQSLPKRWRLARVR